MGIPLGLHLAMRPLHSRKARTSIADARQYLRDGHGWGMRAIDYLTDAERFRIAQEVNEQLSEVTRNQFPRTGNLEYAVLKAHLIVEFALTQLIRCSSYALVEPEAVRFTFAQKLEIAVLFGFGNGCPTTVPSIELLNRLRNQIAHRFAFDRALLTELIRLNSEDFDPTKLTDRQLITCLRQFCSFTCGLIAGHIRVAIELSRKAQPALAADAPQAARR